MVLSLYPREANLRFPFDVWHTGGLEEMAKTELSIFMLGFETRSWNSNGKHIYTFTATLEYDKP
jgi:hypothetical protein